jgi:hypothetical protein
METFSGASTFDGAVDFTGTSQNGSNVMYALSFKTRKRVTPTMTLYRYTGQAGQWNFSRNGALDQFNTANIDNMKDTGGRIYVNIGVQWTAGNIAGHWVADAEL